MSYNSLSTAVNICKASAPPPLESPSVIRDSVTTIETLVDELGAVIEAVERRLDTVLTPTPPTVDKAGAATPSPATSHLEGRLNDVQDRLTYWITYIRRVIERVEV